MSVFTEEQTTELKEKFAEIEARVAASTKQEIATLRVRVDAWYVRLMAKMRVLIDTYPWRAVHVFGIGGVVIGSVLTLWVKSWT